MMRVRVVEDADAGLSSKELAERYHVSRAWVDALKQRRRETGAFAARRQTTFRARVLAGSDERLAALLAARPDATLAELREALATSARRSSAPRGPRTFDHVAALIAAALELFTPAECRNYLQHCGYRVAAQLRKTLV